MAAAHSLRFRSLGKNPGAGLLITVLVHGAIAAVVVIGQLQTPDPPEAPRDVIVTQLMKFGRPRPKYYLPRIAAAKPRVIPPTVIKVTDNANAVAAPKEAPKVEDVEISKDLRRALERAKSLVKAAADEPEEGSLQGSAQGTASQATNGDEYLTSVHEAIRKNWSAPSGLVADTDLQALEVEVRLSIGDDGTLIGPAVRKPSGNQFFDDSAIAAVKATGHVPAPPPELRGKFRRGLAIVFAGKDLAR